MALQGRQQRALLEVPRSQTLSVRCRASPRPRAARPASPPPPRPLRHGPPGSPAVARQAASANAAAATTPAGRPEPWPQRGDRRRGSHPRRVRRRHPLGDARRATGRPYRVLLAGAAPLLAHDRRAERLRRHHRHQVFGPVDRLGDLLPPAAPAFHVGEVLPEREAVLLLQAPAQIAGEVLAVAPGVGDENARRCGCCCHGGLVQCLRRDLHAMVDARHVR